jgi:hypothetical protein
MLLLPTLGFIRVDQLRILGSSRSNCQAGIKKLPLRPRDNDAVSGRAYRAAFFKQ